MGFCSGDIAGGWETLTIQWKPWLPFDLTMRRAGSLQPPSPILEVNEFKMAARRCIIERIVSMSIHGCHTPQRKPSS